MRQQLRFFQLLARRRWLRRRQHFGATLPALRENAGAEPLAPISTEGPWALPAATEETQGFLASETLGLAPVTSSPQATLLWPSAAITLNLASPAADEPFAGGGRRVAPLLPRRTSRQGRTRPSPQPWCSLASGNNALGRTLLLAAAPRPSAPGKTSAKATAFFPGALAALAAESLRLLFDPLVPATNLPLYRELGELARQRRELRRRRSAQRRLLGPELFGHLRRLLGPEQTTRALDRQAQALVRRLLRRNRRQPPTLAKAAAALLAAPRP